MNRIPSPISLREIEASDARREFESLPPIVIASYRTHLIRTFEAYDPEGKIAHELAKNYR